MNVSDYIFSFLNKKGIDTVFMIAGGQAMFLNDAVGRNGNYRIICNHHEQACTMSADAYGRIAHKPAIALVTAGPGSVNAMNGVVGAYTDSSPLIVISGQAALSFVQYQDKTKIRQYGIQGINIRPLVENVTKYFITIDSPKKIKYYLEQAYIEATTGRCGPVWIDVPLDIQNAMVDESDLESYTVQESKNVKFAVENATNQLYSLLKESKRPIFIAGQGISLADAESEFVSLAEKLQIPVLTSRLGIGIIESENRLYVGRPGNYGERSANFAIQNSDLIISIGCRLASALVGHDPKNFGKNAKKFVVDIDSKELNKPGVTVDYKINLDCADFIKGMLKKADKTKIPNYDSWINICNGWKKRYPVVLESYKKEEPINSYYFTDRLSALTSKDDAILLDTGSCFHVVCQTWKVKRGQSFLTTGGLSSMGYWPAGIGACLANNMKNTIVITGDGSLQMNLQEFATIKHNNLPIKVIIFNNNGYLLIRQTQRNFMEGRLLAEGPDTGVWCPDSIKIAEAYGIKGVRIKTVEEIDTKIKEVLDYAGPVICDVITPEWQLLIPRVSSDKLPDGRLVSRNYEDMFPYLSREELLSNMVAVADNKDE
jgi:acetolactate synthase I/II/III large subunit